MFKNISDLVDKLCHGPARQRKANIESDGMPPDGMTPVFMNTVVVDYSEKV